MKHFVLMMALILFVVPGCRAEEKAGDSSAPVVEKLVVEKSDGTKHEFTVEMATTPEARTIGLMFRKSMDPNAGMLFVFEKEEMRAFWMKNTLIPLDMVFIKKNGVIDSIHANAIPHDETPAPSKGLALGVLEINGGRAAELGIKPGDIIHHNSFGNPLAQPAPIH